MTGYLRWQIFPIFSWDLFSYVPGEFTDYGLRVTHTDGKALSQPIYFEDAQDLFQNTRSVVAYRNIQLLGRAIAMSQSSQAELIKARVETLYFPNSFSLNYEIVKRKSLPLTRWQNGNFVSEEVIVKFQTSN